MTKARELSDYTGLQGDITAGDTAARAGRKNLLLNGSMQISQRGDYTSATAISDGTYYLDRWELDIATVTGTVQDVSNGYLSKLNTQKIAATSTATGRLVSIQKIEVSGGMLGAELTASAQVKSNSTDARLFLVDNTNGTVLDVVAHTGGGAFEKLTISGTAPTSCTDLRVYLALRGSAQGNVAITSGDYFEFTNVQLELGSVATDFEHRSYGEELQLCQRYYETQYFNSLYLGTGQGSHNLRQAFFSVTKRASPTLTTAFTISAGSLPTATVPNTGGYRYGRIADNSAIQGFSGTVKADAEL